MGKMKVWYDADGDYLELGMTGQKGSFKDVGHDIWERVDTKGRIIGVAIANFLKRQTRAHEEVEIPLDIVFHQA